MPRIIRIALLWDGSSCGKENSEKTQKNTFMEVGRLSSGISDSLKTFLNAERQSKRQNRSDKGSRYSCMTSDHEGFGTPC